MRSLIPVIIATLIANLLTSFAGICEPIFSQDISKPEIEWIDDKVAIIFYHGDWHVEILANGYMYSRSLLGSPYPRSFEVATRAAKNQSD